MTSLSTQDAEVLSQSPKPGPGLQQSNSVAHCECPQNPRPLQAVQLQARLDSLATHCWVLEMLKPPCTRSFMGAWMLGCELLLRVLPSDDEAAAENQVSPAWT